ncbi:MAG: tetratricopeptide repeat protein, partial [bacterium]
RLQSIHSALLNMLDGSPLYTLERAIYYPRSFNLLGKIYEKKGDTQLAIQNYEKFLDLWKDADKDLPDLIDAKKRLAKLKEMSNKGSC